MYYFLKQAHIKNKNPLAERCKKQELPDWTKEAAPSAPLEEIPADCSCSETLSASFSLASANPKLKTKIKKNKSILCVFLPVIAAGNKHRTSGFSRLKQKINKGCTFKEIRVEFRGVYDEPRLALLEIRTEFTILCRERT